MGERGCRKTDNVFERKGSVADPDPQIRGGAGGGGGVHPNPEIKGGLVLKKQIFRLFGPQFGPKMRSTTEDSFFYQVNNSFNYTHLFLIFTKEN